MIYLDDTLHFLVWRLFEHGVQTLCKRQSGTNQGRKLAQNTILSLLVMRLVSRAKAVVFVGLFDIESGMRPCLINTFAADVSLSAWTI